MASKSTTPAGFRAYLVKRWNEGCTIDRQAAPRGDPSAGYSGGLTHRRRLLDSWRHAHFAAEVGAPAPERSAARYWPGNYQLRRLLRQGRGLGQTAMTASRANHLNPRTFSYARDRRKKIE
jgi:hypothetical protein